MAQDFRPRMLLVEDDPDTLEVLIDLLGETFDILAARDGKQALDLVHEQAPHIIVTDESLPIITGTQLARQLREEGFTTPILLVTGYSSGLDISCCNAVLAKPIEVDELVRAALHLLAGEKAGEHAVP